MTPQQTENDRTAAVAVAEACPERESFEASLAVARARWPELNDFQTAWLARVATDLALDLLREEVTWFPDRPYVTSKGLLRLLNRHPQFDNYELEPASDDLRRAMRVARDDEQVWVCRVFRKDRSRPAVGYGRATPDDTSAGYGRIPDGEFSDPGRSVVSGYRTLAVPEMAQERAVRHAAQSAFAWELPSTLEAPADPEHRRVEPDAGEVSTETEDGLPNTVGCTAAQRRCIHALAHSLLLPEGQVDEETGEVVEEGWRTDLHRLYGVTSTMRLTSAQAGEFIDALTRDRRELDEPEGPQEAQRHDLWRQIAVLLRRLPRDTPRNVCGWLYREHGLDMRPEQLRYLQPPARVPTVALRRLVQGLEGYLLRLEPEA